MSEIRHSLPREPDSSSTRHRVSKGFVNEILRQNQAIIEEGWSEDDALEKDSKRKIDETQFRENQLKDAQIDRYKQDTELRKAYADKVFRFMVGYTIAMFSIVFLSGWKFPVFYVDTVPLTTLIGSSFASTIGLVILVIKGLFPVQRESPKATAKSNRRSRRKTRRGAEIQ